MVEELEKKLDERGKIGSDIYSLVNKMMDELTNMKWNMHDGCIDSYRCDIFNQVYNDAEESSRSNYLRGFIHDYKVVKELYSLWYKPAN